jgi:protein O-GlcNAc transferase
MPTISEMLAQAGYYRRAGDMARAEQTVRAVLQAQPDNVEALHLLGVSLHASGRLAEAVQPYEKALRLAPTRADVGNDLGTALAMQNRLDEAIAAYRHVVEHQPDFAEAHCNLGNALRLKELLEDAIHHLTRAVQLKPGYTAAHHNLGLAYLQQGNAERAIAAFQEAVRLSPTFADAYNDLGHVLKDQGRFDEAIACFRHILWLRPASPEAHSNLGLALKKQGRLDDAAKAFREAIRLKPTFAAPHSYLGSVLRDQAQLDEAIECLRKAREVDPDNHSFHSSYLGHLALHSRYDQRAIFEEHRRWDEQYARRYTQAVHSPAGRPGPEGRLRIGYVSPDFRNHVVGRNIWPLLRHHDHERFEMVLYASLERADDMTERFRQLTDKWYDIASWPDDKVSEQIQQDGIDILVDLAVHTTGNRLLVFARKPAPVQVSFAGYPGTTGLSAVDYRLTDPYLDPPGPGDAYFAEKPYRLRHSFWCFDPQTEEPAVGPLPALEKGTLTFGCLNAFVKVNEQTLELWAQILSVLEGSRLVLLAKEGSHRQRTIEFFVHRGVAAERVSFLSMRQRPEYLAFYHQIDIALDTLPYNGHTTSLDTLWMGVPFITLVGNTVVGRAGLSLLANMGLEEFAARTPAEFVRLAVTLAGDLPRLAALRADLRERMRRSPLMNAEGFARNIEEAYRTMWRTWCAQQQAIPEELHGPDSSEGRAVCCPLSPVLGGEGSAVRGLGTASVSPSHPCPSPPEYRRRGEIRPRQTVDLTEHQPDNPVIRLPAPDKLKRLSLYQLFDDVPRLKVIDVGASPIDGPPPYAALFEAGRVDLLGFEPDPQQHQALLALNRAHATYLPYAIGDGSAGTLHICKAPGMTSLLEPDMEILQHFHGFADWGTVQRKVPVETRRLDNIPEAAGADYLKLDLQGGELAVLRGAPRLLEDLLVIHVEVQFVPFYKDQPLFAELDQALRNAGFWFHRFFPVIGRVFRPVSIDGNPYAGLSQQLWSDAIYVKRFTDFGRQNVPSLLKLAAMLNDLYGSFDLCALALQHADRQGKTQRMRRYVEALRGLS